MTIQGKVTEIQESQDKIRISFHDDAGGYGYFFAPRVDEPTYRLGVRIEIEVRAVSSREPPK